MKSSLPRSSSRLTAVARSHRLRLFTRSLRIRWRFGVGAAASSLWLFWVPPTHRRIYESAAVRSPFICCASTAGNADSRATYRIVRHRKSGFHPRSFSYIQSLCVLSHFYRILSHLIPFAYSLSPLVVSRAKFTFRRRDSKHQLIQNGYGALTCTQKTRSFGFLSGFLGFRFVWAGKLI